MKNKSIFNLLLMLVSVLTLNSCAKTVTANGFKKVRVIEIERELPFPIETVWSTIFLNYGDACKFNPHSEKSGYIGDADMPAIGVERFMQNDKEGKEMLYERIVEFDESNTRMKFKIFDAKKVPIDTDATYGESQLIKLDDNRTLFKIKFSYRTSPKFLANFAHKRLTNQFKDMAIGMEHYLTTGEPVSSENFASIKEQYD